MRYLIILLIVLLTSCIKESFDTVTTYHIKEGNHKSTVKFETLTSEELKFSCKFEESAIYELNDEDQLDINKLYGFSDCNNNHQDNSARFGWRWNNRLEIFTYVYNNGVRNTQILGSVDVNTWNEYSIQITDNSYVFTLNGRSTTVERTSDCNRGTYYMLYPYFGGNQTAPHDIRLYIKEEAKR